MNHPQPQSWLPLSSVYIRVRILWYDIIWYNMEWYNMTRHGGAAQGLHKDVWLRSLQIRCGPDTSGKGTGLDYSVLIWSDLHFAHSLPFQSCPLPPISIMSTPSHFYHVHSLPFQSCPLPPISIMSTPSHFNHVMSFPFLSCPLPPISIMSTSHVHSLPFQLFSLPISTPSHFHHVLSIPFLSCPLPPISIMFCPFHFCQFLLDSSSTTFLYLAIAIQLLNLFSFYFISFSVMFDIIASIWDTGSATWPLDLDPSSVRVPDAQAESGNFPSGNEGTSSSCPRPIWSRWTLRKRRWWNGQMRKLERQERAASLKKKKMEMERDKNMKKMERGMSKEWKKKEDRVEGEIIDGKEEGWEHEEGEARKCG